MHKPVARVGNASTQFCIVEQRDNMLSQRFGIVAHQELLTVSGT